MRESNKPAKLVAMANAMHPMTATAKNRKTTFFGPCLSNQCPKGNWVIEKPKKYPPANKPRSRACRPNSMLKVGDKVAVIARNSADKKYAAANAKNTHHYLDLYLPMRFYSPGFGGAK
jgi:hypothetical protein